MNSALSYVIMILLSDEFTCSCNIFSHNWIEVVHILINAGPKIGQGAFGIVVRALAYGIRYTEPTTVVAVKMAKGECYCLQE